MTTTAKDRLDMILNWLSPGSAAARKENASENLAKYLHADILELPIMQDEDVEVIDNSKRFSHVKTDYEAMARNIFKAELRAAITAYFTNKRGDDNGE